MIKFRDICLNEGVVVHLRTQKQCNKFSKWLNSKGKRWSSCNSYLKKNYWSDYEETTCYNPYKGTYKNVCYYKEKGLKILSYEEALLKDEKNIKDIIYFKEAKHAEEPAKELTIEEIQKELGYKIKIVEK